jgi:lysozyme family protein
MQPNYKPFVDRMIETYEGGYGWDKADAGGPTKYGITCYDLAENRGTKMTSMASWAPLVKAMTLTEAEDIYRKKYAAKVRFDELPSGVDCVMMDYGVNSGPSRAIRVARALLSVPAAKVDQNAGVLDDALLAAIKRSGPAWFINAMCDERMVFLRGLRNWGTFGKGWTARVKDLREYALAVSKKGLSPKSPIPVPAPPVDMPPVVKATHVEPVTTDATLGTTVSAGAGAAVSYGGFPWEIVLLVVLAGVLVTAFLIWWKRSKQTQADQTVVLPQLVSNPYAKA